MFLILLPGYKSTVPSAPTSMQIGSPKTACNSSRLVRKWRAARAELGQFGPVGGIAGASRTLHSLMHIAARQDLNGCSRQSGTTHVEKQGQ
jgi:hypothetical protein